MSENASRPPVDLREMLRVLKRRKLLLLLPWMVAVAGGVAAAFLLTPIYFSTVTLMLERPQTLSGPLGGMVGSRNPDQQAEVMREQVQSTVFLRGAISASRIASDPQTRAWALKSAVRYHTLSGDAKIEAFLVDELREAISIKRGRGNIFQVTVADPRPDRAHLLAASVADQFVTSSKAAVIAALRATSEFSLEQQQVYKKKLEESEARLDLVRRAAVSNTLTGSSVSEANLSRAHALLDQAGLDVEEQSQRVAALRAQLSGRVREQDPDLLSSPETGTLIAQLASLERRLASAALLVEPNGDNGGAARQAIARKVPELEAQLLRNSAAALPGLAPEPRDLLVRYRLADADLAAKQSRRDFLSSQVSAYERHAVAAPDRDLELQRLTQEVDNNRALYNAFLQQSASVQIAEAFENAKVSGRFVVLEPANLPLSPGKPNRAMLIVLALVLGGVIGVGSVLVVEQHDQSVRNTEEVESLLGLPVLGAVPRAEELERSRRRARPQSGAAAAAAKERNGLLQRLEVESPLGLEFRRIYLQLARSRGRSLPSTLLITSSMRGEGKTTITACLAITLARELRERVLLVDFDLRSPALHRALGLPGSSWGLAHMLQQNQFDERFVRTTTVPRLDFLPAGKGERPAAELLDVDSVEWFVREARSRYPLVIMDSAPTLAVPDPLILGRAVEGVIYVIRAGSTIRKAAEYGVKVQREARDNLLGVLLNDAGDVLPRYYGYHDAYGNLEAAAGDS